MLPRIGMMIREKSAVTTHCLEIHMKARHVSLGWRLNPKLLKHFAVWSRSRSTDPGSVSLNSLSWKETSDPDWWLFKLYFEFRLSLHAHNHRNKPSPHTLSEGVISVINRIGSTLLCTSITSERCPSPLWNSFVSSTISMRVKSDESKACIHVGTRSLISLIKVRYS